MPGLSRLAFGAFRYSGASWLARAARPGAVVLCYHNVVDGPVNAADEGLHMPVARFRAQMEWLTRHFDVVTLDELRARAEGGQSLRGLAAVTFDDAYVGACTHGLEVLLDLVVPSTIFVPSAFPSSGRPFWWDRAGAAGAATDEAKRHRFLEEMRGDGQAIATVTDSGAPLAPQCLPASWDDLRDLVSELVALGAHSVSHRTLPLLSDDDLAAELAGSSARIAEMTGIAAPRWFAYPYGRWDARVARAVRTEGYSGAFTLAGDDVARGVDWAAAPRINVPANIPDAAFEAWVSGFTHFRSRLSRR